MMPYTSRMRPHFCAHATLAAVQLWELGRRRLICGMAIAVLMHLFGCGPARKEPLFVLPATTNRVAALALSPDGRTLAVGGSDPRRGVAEIQLWNLERRERLRVIHAQGTVTLALAFSPDGQILYSGGNSLVIGLWRVADGVLQHALQDIAGIESLAISADGRTLVTVGGDGTPARVWNVTKRLMEVTLPRGQADFTAIALAPDGRTVLAGKAGLGLELFELPSGRQTRKLHPQGRPYEAIEAMAISRDGRFLATGSNGGFIEVWDLSHFQSLRAFRGHQLWLRETYSIEALALDARGDRLASTGLDGVVRLWDVRTGTQTAMLSERSTGALWWDGRLRFTPCCVVFAPGGMVVVSGHEDQGVRFWSVR